MSRLQFIAIAAALLAGAAFAAARDANAAPPAACPPDTAVEVQGTIGGLPSYAPEWILVLTETVTPCSVGTVELKPAVPRSCKRGGSFVAKGRTDKDPTSYTLHAQSVTCN